MEKHTDKPGRILLFYPPGPLFQRGEDRCQQNVDDGSAQAMRACNDLGYAAAVLLKKDYKVKLRDYQTEKATEEDLFQDMERFKPDMIMLIITNRITAKPLAHSIYNFVYHFN